MLKNVLCPMMASAAVLLGGCGASALSTANHSSGESSLKGVYDTKYYLQLKPEHWTQDEDSLECVFNSQSKPVGDLCIYKFEICLVASLGSCVGALKTNTGDDLLLNIKTLSELSLTESEKTTLLKNREEYLAYQQSLKRRTSDIVKAVGISSGVVIGGGGATLATKKITKESADMAVRVSTKVNETQQKVLNGWQQAKYLALEGIHELSGKEYAQYAWQRDKATDLVARVNSAVRQAKRNAKFYPPAIMLATAVLVLNVGYLFGKDHVKAHANVQDVLAEHDELSTLINYGSPLLSVEYTYNEPVSSVETVLLNFAKWQALVSSYSSDSSIVVEKICLPKVTVTSSSASLEEDCHTLSSSKS